MTAHRFHVHSTSPLIVAGVLATGLLLSSHAVAQTQQGGNTLFSSYCATCHGSSAKGDGPLAGEMKNRPPDLTQLAAQNGGIFPADQVARTIDGRQPVKGHGGTNMPVWGDVFAKSTADPTPVNQKIEALVRYLGSIQIKP